MDDHLERLRMSETARLISIRATLAGRWQLPLLVVGIAVLAAGFGKMARERCPTSCKDQLAIVARLRQAKAYARASAYLMAQLGKPGRPAPERGELARLLANVIYDAEAEVAEHNSYNTRRIISN